MPIARHVLPGSAIALTACALVAGCAQPASDDVVGPFTGARHRFVVDDFKLPINNATAKELGDDLDGDGYVDNQLGMVISLLASQDDVTTHARDMIASGLIASTVEIQADDLLGDDRAGVWYYGADDTPVVPVGGRIVDGVFTSNRTVSTQVPGTAVLRLPVFVDADPSEVELLAMELDLTPDGRGGFDGSIRGMVRHDRMLPVARMGITQLLEARPEEHRTFWWIVDQNRDGTVEERELTQGLIGGLLGPDLQAPGKSDFTLLSFGFGIHISPCGSGRCGSPPADTCFDRIVDGDETGLDCGGACRSCPGGETCRGPADCRTGACDGGRCRAPSCEDDVLNGFESDLDCGGTCSSCSFGQRCSFDSDCASGHCGSNHICY